jgi:hypothetical protein
MQGDHQQFQEACRIWFCPSEEHVASALRQLPSAEREQVWADLSGNMEIAKASLFEKEDPALVTSGLIELDRELALIPSDQKLDFLLAQESVPDYTNDSKFRLMFLRSTSLNATMAATKMVNHFMEKRELFGAHTLGRDIVLSDMDADALETIASGGVHFLPRPDKGGRLISFARQCDLKYKKREDVVSQVKFWLAKSCWQM